MKKVIGIFSLIVIFGCALASAAEFQIQDALFVPVAYVNDQGKILDANHVLLGRIDKDGIVYDVTNKNLGFVGSDLTVRDVHHKVLAAVDQGGAITDVGGGAAGFISSAKVTDGAGKVVARYEGPVDKRQVLAYLFFFSKSFER
jgi:hypothetical protein